MDELMPCPFCGMAATTYRHKPLPGLPCVSVEVDHVDGCPLEGAMGFIPMHHTEAEAIAAWNTRTPPATQAGDALVEELARGLYEADWPRPHHRVWENALPHLINRYRLQARAILPIIHHREAAAHAAGRAENTGWVVGNGDKTKWRSWGHCGPTWVSNIEDATRYHRREDAEAVHREDDDAWVVCTYADAIERGQHKEPGDE